MKLGVTLDILNQKDTPAFYADTLANRPAAGFTGRVFISTDTLDLYRDTGTTWVLLSPSSTGTITGSGAAGQVTYFSAASSITGSNNLFWDTANNRLGVNTNTPTATFDVHGTTNVIAQLNQLTTGQNALLTFMDNSVGKWRLGNIYNAAANDFGIVDITNTLQRLTIKNTGQTFIGTETTSSGLFVVNTNTNDNHIVVLGNQAPSIRIRTAGVAAPLQCGIGLSTTTNNFIQGAVGGEFCLYNDSVTAQPILFGVNATSVVLEAARISASRNLLVGGVVDNGSKLQITGTSTFSSSLTITAASSTLFMSLRGRSSDNFGFIGFYNNTGITRYGYIQSHSANGGQLNITADGGAQLIMDSNGSIFNTGNLSIGVTPSAGGLAGYKLFEIAQFGASIYGGTNQTLLGTNISWNGSSANYSGGYSASLYNQQNGAHSFSTAPLGVAGNPITFTTILTIKATGVINIANVPTSAAGLVSGDVYRTANVLNIVP